MYKEAFLIIAADLVLSFLCGGFLSLGICIFMGIMGNYLYMNKADKDIQFANSMPENQKSNYLLSKGGTSVGAVIAVYAVYIVITALIVLLLITSGYLDKIDSFTQFNY